jgi:tight adherence protein B
MGMAALLAGATFCLVFFLMVGSYWLLIVRSEEAARSTIQKRLRGAALARAGNLIIAAEQIKSLPAISSLLSKVNFVTKPTTTLLERAGMKFDPSYLLLGSVGVGMLFALLIWQALGVLWVGVGVGVLAAFIPLMVMRRLATLRMRKFEEQFPEAVDLIARSLRAGHSFATGLRLASEEMQEPAGSEFRRLYDQQNFGMPIPDALRDFAARIAIVDARFFVTAVLTQREAGGNLAEVLDNLSAVIRDRFRIMRQIRVASAHGRLTGTILSALPPVMAGLFIWRSPEQMREMIVNPVGVRMVIGAIVLQLVGAFLISKLTKIDY